MNGLLRQVVSHGSGLSREVLLLLSARDFCHVQDMRPQCQTICTCIIAMVLIENLHFAIMLWVNGCNNNID